MSDARRKSQNERQKSDAEAQRELERRILGIEPPPVEINPGESFDQYRQRIRSGKRRYDLGGSVLNGANSVLDYWNEFMLPGGVPEETKRALKEKYPDTFAEKITAMEAARASAKEGAKRFAGAAAANLYGVDEEGNLKLPGYYDSGLVLPGIVDQTMALPAFFGAGEENWPRSNAALRRTEATEEQLRGGLNYTPADEPWEYFVESGGSMAGQVPLPGKYMKAVKAPLEAAGKWAKETAGPIVGGLGSALATIPGAAAEFFGPVIDPKLSNYLQGTLAGGVFRTAADALSDQEEEPSPEEIEAYLETLLSKGDTLNAPEEEESPMDEEEITEEEKMRRLIQLQRDILRDDPSNEVTLAWLQKHDPDYGFDYYAKGGKVTTKGGLIGLLRDALSGPGVEKGKELAPIEPPKNLPEATPAVPTMEQLDELAAKVSKPDPIGPISRRTVLQGMASLMNPLDPLAAVDLKLDNLLEGVAPAAKGVVAAAPMSKSEIAQALNGIVTAVTDEVDFPTWQSAIDALSQIPGGKKLADDLELSSQAASEDGSYEFPYEEFSERAKELAEEHGVLTVPERYEDFGDVESGPKRPTMTHPPIFVEPPEMNARELIEEEIAALKDHDPEAARGLQKIIDHLGDDLDTALAQDYLAGSEGSNAFDDVWESQRVDPQVWDYVVDQMESLYGDIPGGIAQWADATPEARRKFHEARRAWREAGRGKSWNDPDHLKALDELKKAEAAIWPENAEDQFRARVIAQDLSLDEE